MANPNDATFHAKITADASDFIQQTQLASEALTALVAQSSKAGKGGATPKGPDTKAADSEAKRLGASMRAEQEKTTRVVQDNIKEENRLRAEGVRAAGASSGLRNFVTAPKPLTTMPGPTRDEATARGFLDAQKLQREFQLATGAVDGYTRKLTEAEKISRKLAEIKVTPEKNLGTLIGPVRNETDAKKLIAGAQQLRRERYLEGEQVKAILEDRKRMAAQQAAIARQDRKQMDAMVTGRYALYDLAEGYDVVGRAGLRFLGFFKQAIQTTAEFETAFTSVEGAIRPLPGEVEALKQSLIDLTQTIPLSFTQIAEIATLGAQMGIAAGDIDNFTKTVASFSAVTGASIDETAESFGRIASLADVPVAEFDKLASAITYAGVNAVATEEQILTLTQSIAASSRQAGFSADEIVGLATALASLGIQPEQARGVLLRVFGAIGQEIDKAGEKLEVYSKISGMSAEQIKASWGTDPKAFFGAFLQGLDQVENKTQAFTAAGFVDTREINVLQRLSQNMDVYNSALQDSINAYADGTYLGDRYAMTVDNIASKITILQNNIAAFGESIGSAVEGPLKGLIDALSFVLIAITNFAKTPLGGFVVAFVAVTATLVTVLSLVAAASFRATAQLFAMRTAMIQMAAAGSTASGGLRELIQTMLGQVRMMKLASGDTVFFTKKQAIANGVLKQWTAAAGTATIATRGLTMAIRVLGIASGILTGLTLIGIAAEMMGISTEAKKLEGIDFSNLSDAIRRDTQAMRDGEQVYGTFKVSVADTADALGKASLAHEGVEVATKAATGAIDDNTVAFGKNTEAALRNAIAGNEAIKKTMESFSEGGWLSGSMDLTDELESMGGSWEGLIQASLKDPGEGAIKYLQELNPRMSKEIAAALNPVIGGYTDFTAGLRFDFEGQKWKEIADLAVVVDNSSKELKDGASYASLWGVGISDAADGASDSVDELGEDVKSTATLIEESFNAINSEMKLQEAIEDLGNSLKENGKEFDIYSEGGRENIKALQGVISGYVETSGSDANLLATNLQTLMQALGVMGVNSATALNMVTEALRVSGGVSAEVTAEALALLTGGLTTIPSAAGAAQTALEKLQGAIDKTFAKMDRKLQFQDSLSSLRDSLLENGSNFSRFSESGRNNIGAVRDMIESLAERSNGNSRVFSSSLNAMKKAMINAGLGGTKAVAMINKAIKASGSNAKASAAQVRQFANALRILDAGNVIAVSNAIESLTDSVMNYLNARWMLGNTQMEIAAGWESIAEEADDASDSMRGVREELAALAAEGDILEYQLEIALKYGDTLRANELRAQIAELRAREEDLRNGDSDGAQGNLLAQQQALQQMVGYYVQLGAAEVIGAKNKKEAKGAIKGTVDAFKEQARAAGVSEDNVKKYAKELRIGLRMAKDLNKPTQYKVNSATKTALDNIKNFALEAKNLINSIPNNIRVTATTSIRGAGTGRAMSMGGAVYGSGSSTSDSIPAMLSNGEFVMRASAVKTYGVDFMNSVNRMQVSRSMPSQVQPVAASDSSVVYLSPEDRNLLRAAMDRPINLYTDNAKIAQSANNGNVLLAQRGLK